MWHESYDIIEEGIFLLEPDGTFFKVNPAFSEITGYSQSELKKRDVFSITHPEDIEHEKVEYSRLLGGEITHINIVKRFITKNNESIWVRLVVHKNDHLFCQAITIKNGAREQIKKVQNKVEIVEHVSLARYIKHNYWKIGQVIAAIIITLVGWICSAYIRMGMNDAKFDSRIQHLEELLDKSEKTQPASKDSKPAKTPSRPQ